MDDEQAMQEIQASLEHTVGWMRQRNPADWAKVQVPGEPHRFATLQLYLLLRVEARLAELLTRLEDMSSRSAYLNGEHVEEVRKEYHTSLTKKNKKD